MQSPNEYGHDQRRKDCSGIGVKRWGGATFLRGMVERFYKEEEAILEANALPSMRLFATLIFSS